MIARRLAVLLAAGAMAASPSTAAPPELERSLVVGYQGWFNADGDGAGRGWTHWTTDRRKPGPHNIRVDLWPDLTEYGPGERFPTDFTGPDGKPAELFSSFHPDTVRRHFRWMREYGIDGAFLQRFPNELRDAKARAHRDTVLAHCRAAAAAEGRSLALMYDLTGLPAARFGEVTNDWRRLAGAEGLAREPFLLHHRGKPLVALWGVGFNDRRPYGLEDCARLLDFFHAEGCAVLLGVPAYWRTRDRDAVADPALHDLLARAEALSPWTVGRYGTPEGAAGYAAKTLREDLAWCRERGVALLPVAFPGFSWHNMNRETKPNPIPRRGGAFFQAQIDANLQAGATMLYVAMFDEVDEATAIFKCADRPPRGRPFVSGEGLPSDHYLKLAGQAAARLKPAPR